jgi:hypothetical protein
LILYLICFADSLSGLIFNFFRYQAASQPLHFENCFRGDQVRRHQSPWRPKAVIVLGSVMVGLRWYIAPASGVSKFVGARLILPEDIYGDKIIARSIASAAFLSLRSVWFISPSQIPLQQSRLSSWTVLRRVETY